MWTIFWLSDQSHPPGVGFSLGFKSDWLVFNKLAKLRCSLALLTSTLFPPMIRPGRLILFSLSILPRLKSRRPHTSPRPTHGIYHSATVCSLCAGGGGPPTCCVVVGSGVGRYVLWPKCNAQLRACSQSVDCHCPAGLLLLVGWL